MFHSSLTLNTQYNCIWIRHVVPEKRLIIIKYEKVILHVSAKLKARSKLWTKTKKVVKKFEFHEINRKRWMMNINMVRMQAQRLKVGIKTILNCGIRLLSSKINDGIQVKLNFNYKLFHRLRKEIKRSLT